MTQLAFRGSYRFLSNFYACNIRYLGYRFPSIEHAYQAAKSEDPSVHRVIQGALSPGRAKRLGRLIRLKPTWDEERIPLMLMFLRLKFEDSSLRPLLLATGKESLVEENYWHDNFWGNCTCLRCADLLGQNHLGRLLMQVREEVGEDHD